MGSYQLAVQCIYSYLILIEMFATMNTQWLKGKIRSEELYIYIWAPVHGCTWASSNVKL